MKTIKVKLAVFLIIFLFTITSFGVIAGSSDHGAAKGSKTNLIVKPLTSGNNTLKVPFV